VVFGDHDAGFARDASLARRIGIGIDDVAWALNDRVPLFIRAGRAGKAAGAARARGEEETGEAGGDLIGARAIVAGQTDFAPTVLALLGIDPTPLPYLGRNLLASAGDRPVPRPYGDWLDDQHLFRAGSAGASCYDVGRRAIVAPSACAVEDARARRLRDLSHLIVIDDLQQQLRERLTTPSSQ